MRLALPVLSLLLFAPACAEEPVARSLPADPPLSLAILVLAQGDASLLWETAPEGALSTRRRAGTVFASAWAASDDPAAARWALERGLRAGRQTTSLAGDLFERVGERATTRRFGATDEPSELRAFFEAPIAAPDLPRVAWVELLDPSGLDPWLAAVPDPGPLLVLTSVLPPGDLAQLAPKADALSIPLLFHLPGVVPEGDVRPQLVSAIDLVPTFLELLGCDTQGLDGKSFARLLRKRPQVWRNHAVLEGGADCAWLQVLQGKDVQLGRGRDGALELVTEERAEREGERELLLVQLEAWMAAGTQD